MFGRREYLVFSDSPTGRPLDIIVRITEQTILDSTGRFDGSLGIYFGDLLGGRPINQLLILIELSLNLDASYQE